nr:hypothetical protein [uncultured Desulfuromonas sp.]
MKKRSIIPFADNASTWTLSSIPQKRVFASFEKIWRLTAPCFARSHSCAEEIVSFIAKAKSHPQGWLFKIWRYVVWYGYGYFSITPDDADCFGRAIHVVPTRLVWGAAGVWVTWRYRLNNDIKMQGICQEFLFLRKKKQGSVFKGDFLREVFGSPLC